MYVNSQIHKLKVEFVNIITFKRNRIISGQVRVESLSKYLPTYLFICPFIYPSGAREKLHTEDLQNSYSS